MPRKSKNLKELVQELAEDEEEGEEEYSDEEKIKKFEEKLAPKKRFRKALRLLGKVRPFIRGIVSRCKPSFVKKDDEKIPTACVMIRPNRKFKMYFNPKFVMEQKTEQHLAGVINHEINHLVRGHLTLDRTGLDAEVLNIALEVHANMDIPKSWLPPQTKTGEALTHQYFNLPSELRSWKKIYNALFKEFGKKDKRNEEQKNGVKDSGIKKIMKGGGTGHSKKPKAKGKMTKKLKKLLTSKTEVKAMIAKMINKVWDEQIENPTDEQMDKENDYSHIYVGPPISPEECELLKEAEEHTPGLCPGLIDVLIGERPSKIRWEQHLSNFVGSVKKRASSYRRANKRFPNLIGIVPGRDMRLGKVNIVVFVDTSGSCVPFMDQFMAEIKKLSRSATGVVVEWDAAEEAVYKLNQVAQRSSMRGGGGTNFSKCLTDDYIKNLARRFKIKRFDGVVFLTDLYATLPKKSPKVPLMWFIVPGGSMKAPFGKTVSMEI